MKYFTRTNCICSSTYSFNYFCITLYLNPKYSIKCSESWVESLQILLLLLLYFLLWQSHICLTNNFSVVCKKLLLFYIWPPAKIQLIFLGMHNDSGYNPTFTFIVLTSLLNATWFQLFHHRIWKKCTFERNLFENHTAI